MIKCNLAILMAERNINISQLSSDTKISRNALGALYHNTGKGIQYETLDTLCNYFDVNVERLLTYIDVDLYLEKAEWSEDLKQFEVLGELSIQGSHISCRLEVFLKNITSDKDSCSIDIKVSLFREVASFSSTFPEEQFKNLIFDQLFNEINDVYNDLVVLNIELEQKFI